MPYTPYPETRSEWLLRVLKKAGDLSDSVTPAPRTLEQRRLLLRTILEMAETDEDLRPALLSLLKDGGRQK